MKILTLISLNIKLSTSSSSCLLSSFFASVIGVEARKGYSYSNRNSNSNGNNNF